MIVKSKYELQDSFMYQATLRQTGYASFMTRAIVAHIESDLKEYIDQSINFPDDNSLKYNGRHAPYFILEYDTFPLRMYLMKHYDNQSINLFTSCFIPLG